MDNTIYAAHDQPYPEIGTPVTAAQKAVVEKLIAQGDLQGAADYLARLIRADKSVTKDRWLFDLLGAKGSPLGCFVYDGKWDSTQVDKETGRG